MQAADKQELSRWQQDSLDGVDRRDIAHAVQGNKTLGTSELLVWLSHMCTGGDETKFKPEGSQQWMW